MLQSGLFDLENRYASLSLAGDPLERLNAVIDWDIFRPILERIDTKERKTAAGRPVTWLPNWRGSLAVFRLRQTQVLTEIVH